MPTPPRKSPRKAARPDSAAKPTQPAPAKARPPAASDVRWLFLIHQIPPKPDYLRVKIGRRLQRIGAVPIKNSVYVLPLNPDAYEDFAWIVKEIEEGGGDAFISEAALVGEGLTDAAVRARFDAARAEEYHAILGDARALHAAVTRPAKRSKQSKSEPVHQGLEHELARLRRRHESVSAIDFFGAEGARDVATALSEIQSAIRAHTADKRVDPPHGRLDGRTWVTRQDVHVDRIASAWLIRRFIDRRPRFRFVDPQRHVQTDGELRFDMFEAEYTHVGDACTFETLVTRFTPDDNALSEIAEIVHDVDCKDAKFRRDEAPGLARMIAGMAALCPKDVDRIERGSRLFDDLYAAFGGKRVS